MMDPKQQWLTTPWDQDEEAQPRRNPIFRKVVAVEGPVDSAGLDICGLGHYELYINGTRVGDRQLEPAFTNYDRRIYTTSLDIASYLTEGENVLALYLGRGRYNMNTVSVWAFEKSPWREQCRFTMAGAITVGGKAVKLDTTGWTCTEGPIFRDSMYEGEGFDARLEPQGWMVPGFDESGWEPAVEAAAPKGELQPSDFEPIRIVDEVPVARTVFADTERAVFEFPDMLAGNVCIRVTEPAGTRICIKYTESCEDTQVICKQEHVSGEHFQEDEYICRGGGEEVWQARFSYKGFRYVEITGFTDGFTADQVTALDLHQDIRSRGTFTCSNDLINRIHHASCRALLNNAHHVITDTPTYEKNGWTGDAQLTSTMGLYNFEMERFYHKFVTDLRDSQIPTGELAPIVPTSGWGLTDHPNAEGKPFKGHMPAWDGALFVIPWEIYQFTGKTDPIRENYRAMQAYLAFLEGRTDNFILPRGLGDWLPPGGSPSERAIMSSTAWYYRLAGILLDCAALLEDPSCQQRCQETREKIFQAFNARFLNQAGDAYEAGWETEYRQTSALQPLAFGLVPAENRQAVFQRLIAELCSSGQPSLNTGILGTRLLLEVLADHGEVDLAYQILTAEEYPSWGHWFNNGRVSLGEAWELSARSWTHHMFGSIDAWCYQYLCGIRPTAPGFKTITICPHLPTALGAASATVETPAGTVASSWKKEEKGGCLFTFEIPQGSAATFALPEESGMEHNLPEGRSSLTISADGEVTQGE